MARPAKYTDPEEIQQKFEEYLAVCKEGEIIPFVNKRGQLIKEALPICPSIKGFSRFLGFDSVEGYGKMAKKRTFVRVASRVKEDIEIRRDIYSENGIIEPQIARMDYAKRNNLVDSKHTVDVNFNVKGKLAEAIGKSRKGKAKKIKDK